MYSDKSLMARAQGIAESLFYSDDYCEDPWQPFEDYDEEFIKENMNSLAESIFQSLKWAQGDAR